MKNVNEINGINDKGGVMVVNPKLGQLETKKSEEDNKTPKAKADSTLLNPMIFKGHNHAVKCIAVNAVGRVVSSGEWDSVLKLWDLHTAKCISELKGHTAHINSIVASTNANSNLALSGSDDKTLRVWNTDTGECVQKLEGHSSAVKCVALSGNSEFAISGSADETLRLWHLQTGQCTKILKGHSGDIRSVDLNIDGRFALSGGDDKILRLWDLEKGICIQELKGFKGRINVVALLGGGEFALTTATDYDPLRFWNLKAGQSLREIVHGMGIYNMAVFGDLAITVSGFKDTIQLIDFREGGRGCGLGTTFGYRSGKNWVQSISSQPSSISLYVHQSQLYMLVGLQNGTIDFRHICRMREPLPRNVKLLPTKQVENKSIRERELEARLQELNQMLDKKQSQQILQEEKLQEEKLQSEKLMIVLDPINDKDITYVKEIGKGKYGKVFQVKWSYSDAAVKTLFLDDPSDEDMRSFEDECRLMAKLRCPNVVQFYGYCIKPQYAIVMEFMSMGSLYQVLHSKQPLDWNIRMRIVNDIACGLAFLHKKKILHGDIKSLNVLLNENFQAKLTDFGFSKIKKTSCKSTKNVTGTLQWMAPELSNTDEGCNFASDIYSLGITFWEISTRKIPFQEVIKPELIPLRVNSGLRETIPPDCPQKLSTLIVACWDSDPKKRPTADSVAGYLISKEENFAEFLPAFKAEKKVAGSLKSNNKPNIIFRIQKDAGNINIRSNDAGSKNKVIQEDRSKNQSEDYLSDLESNGKQSLV